MRKLLTSAVTVAAFVFVPAAVASPVAPLHPPRVKGESPSTSLNWAGYAAYGQTFSDVKGGWTQPGANCATTASPTHGHGKGGHKAPYTAASFWVGLDGFDSSTVEQTGTDADCNGSAASYYAWYELYPAAPVTLDPSAYPVHPGDSISAEVDAATGTLTITDATASWTYSTTQSFAGDALSSAEWIAEAPSHGRSLPLTDFGTVSFTGASADGSPISAFQNDQITMVEHNGTVRASTSSLTAGGSGFSVTWQHT